MQLWGRMEAELDANTATLTARLRLQLPAVELQEWAWRFRLAGLGFPCTVRSAGSARPTDDARAA